MIGHLKSEMGALIPDISSLRPEAVPLKSGIGLLSPSIGSPKPSA